MKSMISFLFLLQAIIHEVNLVTVALKEPTTDRHLCRGGDFKSETIEKNRDSALNKLVASFKNSSYHGFYHSQAGNKSEEQVSANFLCPPNVHMKLCMCCVDNVVGYLQRHCPKQSEGVGWDSYPYLNCLVRYSTGRKILSVLDDWAWYRVQDEYNVKTVELGKTFDGLLSKLTEQAAGGDDVKKYAVGTVNYDGDEFSLFLSVQCTHDISKGDCSKCLSKASTEIRSCCIEKLLFSGRVLSTNCYIRYWHISFLDAPPYNKEDFSDQLCG